MKIESIEHILITDLQLAYSDENQILSSLPLLIEQAEGKDLKSGLTLHLEETEAQFKRLQNIKKELDVIFTGVTDLAMMYILKSEMTVVQQITDPKLKDLAIIGGCLKVEHYEMAQYEAIITLANKSKHKDISKELEKTLKEEQGAANKLKLLSGGLLSTIVAKIL